MSSNVFELIESILIKSDIPSIELIKIVKTKEVKESPFNILNKLENIQQEKEHHPEGNVWNHTLMVVDMAARVKVFSNNKKEFMWAALLHDIGKITNTKFIKGKWRAYNHDVAGSKAVKELLNKVSSNEEFNNKVVDLVLYHMHHIYISKNLPFGNVDKMLETNNVNDIILLFICDKLGRGKQNIESKEETIKEVIKIVEFIEERENRSYEDLKSKILKISLNL
ncbi:HDIG domain-containing protein [Clostridium carnis]